MCKTENTSQGCVPNAYQHIPFTKRTMKMKDAIDCAHSRYLGQTLIRWNMINAMILFAMALIILVVYDTPAICYILTSIFGLLFVVNAWLGTKIKGGLGLWKGSSYAIGFLMMLFGFSSAMRQVLAGVRPPFEGGWADFYPLIITTFLIGSIGTFSIVSCYNGFRASRL